MPVNNLIQLRKGSSSTWSSQNPVLSSGEPGYDLTNNILKVGDGVTPWNNLSGISTNLDTSLAAGSGIIFSYADSTLTISTSGGGGGGGLNNVVEDITPQLGGNLDLNSYSINGTGNISISGNIIANTGAYNALTVNSISVSVSGHTHTASDITNFNEAVDDRVGSGLLVAGTGIGLNYNDTANTLTINVTNSPRLVTTVFNKTGSTIPKFRAVYINGGQGDQPTITLAANTGDATSAATYGVTSQAIDNMSTGEVVVFGAITGINTDQFNPSAPVGNVNGTILYLSASSGIITSTKPYAPNHIVTIGTVVRTHQNEGVVEVRIINGFELEELHDVAVTGVTNGQFLQYNSSNDLWIPSSSGNFTTLQLNGTTVSVSGHTHTSSDITNFNSSVSGLLPTVSGSGYVRSSFNNNIYTLSVSGLQPSGNYANSTHNHGNITSSGTIGTGIAPAVVTTDSYGVITTTLLGYGLVFEDEQLSVDVPYLNSFYSTLLHTHGNITNDGRIGSTSGLLVTTGASGIITTSSGINSNYITNFNSSVSGLLPVKNISSGSGINVSSTSGNFTISVTGLIANPSDNRILTSRDSSGSLIDAESNLTFVDGGILKIDDPTNNIAASLELHNNTNNYDRVSIRLLDGYGIEQIIIYSNDDTDENSIISYVYPLYITSYLDRLYLSGPSSNYIDLNISSGIDISAPSGINILSNLKINNQTASTIAGFDANKNIASLATSTYPNLTELSYVKGVTSSIQTQLNGKAASSHTHTSSDITNFNSSVSGLLPVKNITAGSGISVSASSGIYTINIDIIDCGQVLAPPNAPTALSATSSNASLVLSWTAPTYAGSTAITGHIVEYTPSGGSASTVNTNSASTSYTLSGLTNGTSYSVRVRAINSIGNGSYSSSVSSIPSIGGLTVLSALSNAGSYTGAGTLASPISWSGNYQAGQSNIFTVNSNGTLYINVTNELKIVGDYMEGAVWYKNNIQIYSSYYSGRSYNFSTPVNTNDTIQLFFELSYGGGVKAFTAYVS